MQRSRSENIVTKHFLKGDMRMEKEVKCPWCGKVVNTKLEVLTGKFGKIKEWRCEDCDGIIAAYLDEDKTVLQKVRTFQT